MEDLKRLPPAAWILIGCALVLGFVLAFAWRWYRRYRARRALRAAVTAGSADHLMDSLVPDGMGGAYHVDFLLLTLRGVVVIDLRDVPGNIFGGDQMAEWTVIDGPHRFTFTNPQGALYDRVAAVKAVAGDVPVEGRIVFTRRGTFPKGLPKWTLMLDALRSEFPAADFETPAESGARYREGWQRLRDAVKPSNMVDMR
ncbi:MAG TPA: nuclease-related domain-containing protein [Steroidobacteraceae bacterium]|nr:nuclease-related domain-containing protein [Steroidobacteraceae bacterium]